MGNLVFIETFTILQLFSEVQSHLKNFLEDKNIHTHKCIYAYNVYLYQDFMKIGMLSTS